MSEADNLAATLCYQPISILAHRLQRGDFTAVALTEALLARIERLDDTLHALRLVIPEQALRAAAKSDAERAAGVVRGPLQGIPYVTKDLFDVAGLPTTAGSETLAANLAASDSAVTRRLREAGMILLGKSHTVEFAFGTLGINYTQGTPHNPWSAEPHTPGGSSSGSAVAVAAGLAPVATATDTACSVRTPAALCGVVGLKTTVGRVSRAGVYPLSPTLDSVGPIARCVEDTALLLMALQGVDRDDPTTAGVEPVDVMATLEDGVQGLRLGVPESPFYRNLHPDVEERVRATFEVFRELGAQVETMAFPEAETALQLPVFPSGVEGTCINAELLAHHGERMDPMIRQRMAANRSTLAVDYYQTLRAMQQLRCACEARLQGIDALLVPTTPLPALPLEWVQRSSDSYAYFDNQYLINCCVGNLLNLCGISLPCGFTHAGLPVGLMIYAKPWQEDLLLRVAHAYEKATPWHTQHPPLTQA